MISSSAIEKAVRPLRSLTRARWQHFLLNCRQGTQISQKLGPQLIKEEISDDISVERSLKNGLMRRDRTHVDRLATVQAKGCRVHRRT